MPPVVGFEERLSSRREHSQERELCLLSPFSLRLDQMAQAARRTAPKIPMRYPTSNPDS